MDASGDLPANDKRHRTTTLVSVNQAGTGAGNAASYSFNGDGERGSISADNRFVTFTSFATDLVANDYKTGPPIQYGVDIFVRDLLTGTTVLITPHITVPTVVYGSYVPAVSADGTTITFFSADTGIVNGETENTGYYFVAHLQAQGSAVLTIHAGAATPSGQISGTVFLDYNADARRQAGEPILAGRTVFLDTNQNGVLDPGEPTAVTDAQGNYSFTGLAAGTYTVREAFPANHGVVPTSPPSGSLSITLASGARAAGADLGLVFISTVVPVEVTAAIYPAHASDADTAYVRGLYHSILGRDAEAAGLNGWVQFLRSGASRLDVSGAIWDSPEHRGVEVDNYYATFLNRAAEARGRAAWITAFRLGASETDVILGFLTSPEYQGKHVSDDTYLNDLYFDVLGRSADAAGLKRWEQLLQSGDSRSAVARGFIDSPESHRQVVDGFYSALLHRAGEPNGIRGWFSELQAGVSFRSVVLGFFTAVEYFENARTHVG